MSGSQLGTLALALASPAFVRHAHGAGQARPRESCGAALPIRYPPELDGCVTLR